MSFEIFYRLSFVISFKRREKQYFALVCVDDDDQKRRIIKIKNDVEARKKGIRRIMKKP